MADWIDEAAKEIAEMFKYGDRGSLSMEPSFARIIREHYVQHTMSQVAANAEVVFTDRNGCVPGGPEGGGLTFDNTGIPGTLADWQKLNAAPDSMIVPLPGRRLGDGQ